MKYLKHINEIAGQDYRNVIWNIPKFYPIFTIKSDKLKSIKKGEKIYIDKGKYALKNNNKLNIGIDHLEFDKYVSEKELEELKNFYRNINKYKL